MLKRFSLLFVLALVCAGVLASSAAALRFEAGDCTEGPGGLWLCPNGTVGSPYAAQLQGAGGCGPALPYQYRILSGSLPPGLALSSSGLISGTPTTGGDYVFYVELSDQDPPSADWCRVAKSERQFSITIAGGQSEPPPTLETNSVPPATLDVSYSASLKATPAGPQTWTVTKGTLPPGLALGTSTGAIAGKPTAVGSYAFTVQVTDSKNRSATREFLIDVRNQLVVIPLGAQGAPNGLPNAEVGIPLAGRLAATGGTGAFTWSLKSGSLPTGVSLAADGAMTGTPAAAGRFAFTAQVADTEGRTATIEALFIVAARLAIATTRLRTGKVGSRLRATLETLGGSGFLEWDILGGRLPPGVRFDKRLGAFVGKPKKSGTYRVTVEVMDSLGASSKRTFRLVVRP